MRAAQKVKPETLAADDAVASLAALAQATRLNVFRLLVTAGPQGMRAGDIAGELVIPANTLSTHLRILTECGLLTVRPESRERIYAVRFEAMRDLIGFLLEDCCKRSPAVCTPLAGVLAKSNCC